MRWTRVGNSSHGSTGSEQVSSWEDGFWLVRWTRVGKSAHGSTGSELVSGWYKMAYGRWLCSRVLTSLKWRIW